MAANSRTTARKTAPRPVRTPREIAPAVREDADEFDAAEAQEIEADAVTSDGYITVPMQGANEEVEDVQVLLSSKWRASAMRALNRGDFDTFMKSVLFEDDYEVYLDLDPEAGEVETFATEVVRLTGENPGKSSGSGTSSRRTRKR
ncbi:hypothetical protein [Streptomyces anulatus]|uniref:hypothetical protein n=1 Tax=Streptomyces anulatus TaxID=1892 RepID=UPI002ECFAEE5|nr:hypothetical protein OG703_33900 [Streptomyces anulatus]